MVYNPTQFIQQLVGDVVRTLYEAILLVAAVVIVFLQTWRVAIIPVVAIPDSLIGCFVFMEAAGITFNTLKPALADGGEAEGATLGAMPPGAGAEPPLTPACRARHIRGRRACAGARLG